jgi:hypothetical protein
MSLVRFDRSIGFHVSDDGWMGGETHDATGELLSRFRLGQVLA